MSGPVDRAKEAWGADLPDWVLELARACAASSQNKVAAQLKRSAAVVSQVIGNTYAAKGGDMQAVEDLVRGALMNKSVPCPTLGQIPSDQCRHWRAKARQFHGQNALVVRMHRACNRCPHFKGGAKDA